MGKSLPMVSAYQHPDSDKLIFIRFGQSGYWPSSMLGVVNDELTADVWNTAHDITKGQAEAMFVGSMFGWHVPAANPEHYTDLGSPVLKSMLDD